MSLCESLGGMTFFEMLEKMDSKEVTMWKAYSELMKEEREWESTKRGG